MAGPWCSLYLLLPPLLLCSLGSRLTGLFVLQIYPGLLNCCSLSVEHSSPTTSTLAASCRLGITSNATLSNLLPHWVHTAIKSLFSVNNKMITFWYLHLICFTCLWMSLLLELNSTEPGAFVCLTPCCRPSAWNSAQHVAGAPRVRLTDWTLAWSAFLSRGADENSWLSISSRSLSP